MRRIETDKARQGRWGYQVFLVLISSLILAALTLGGVELYMRAVQG